MSRRIYFDGLNLSLERGTGIATYTRLLAGLARGLGYDVGASTARRIARQKIHCSVRLRFSIPTMRRLCRGTAGPTIGRSIS